MLNIVLSALDVEKYPNKHYPLMVSFASQIIFNKESSRRKFVKFVYILGY